MKTEWTVTLRIFDINDRPIYNEDRQVWFDTEREAKLYAEKECRKLYDTIKSADWWHYAVN